MCKRVMLLALPFIAALAFGQDALDLRFRPRPGETRKYESKISLEIQGAKIDINIKQANKVLEVTANGDYKQEVTTTEQKMLVNGEEREQPAPPTSSHHRGPRGDVLELSSKIPNAFSQCGVFIRYVMLPETPVKVGDKWTRDFKKDEKLGSSACKLDYEVVGKEKVGDVDVVRVKYEYTGEDKGKATGDTLIRLSDGTPYQLDCKFEGLSPAEGAPPASGTISIKLVAG